MISESFKRFQRDHLMTITLCVMIAGLMFLFVSHRMIVVVPAGHAGAMFRPLSSGTDTTVALDEGAHLIFPWNEVTLYDTRLQTVSQPFDVITKDGLTVQTDIEVRYRITKAQVGQIHRHLGADYLKVMLIPEVAAHARAVVSRYDAEEFYAMKRNSIQEQILVETREGIRRENTYSAVDITFVDLDDVLVKGIRLPALVASAIERKTEQYQRLLEYDYRVQTEQKEAQRKAIEGEGVAKLFANVGSRDLPSYLRLASIEAMLKLAQSGGAKVVVMGGEGKGGVPVIVSADAPSAATAPALAQGKLEHRPAAGARPSPVEGEDAFPASRVVGSLPEGAPSPGNATDIASTASAQGGGVAGAAVR